MSKHRLYRHQEDGTRWSHPASGYVWFSPHGELFRSDGTTVAYAPWAATSEIGEFWEDKDR